MIQLRKPKPAGKPYDARPALAKPQPAKPRVPAENRLVRFYRETRAELRKVVWPPRQEATNLTLIVIAVSVAVGLFLGTVDYVFTKVFELLLGR